MLTSRVRAKGAQRQAHQQQAACRALIACTSTPGAYTSLVLHYHADNASKYGTFLVAPGAVTEARLETETQLRHGTGLRVCLVLAPSSYCQAELGPLLARFFPTPSLIFCSLATLPAFSSSTRTGMSSCPAAVGGRTGRRSRAGAHRGCGPGPAAHRPAAGRRCRPCRHALRVIGAWLVQGRRHGSARPAAGPTAGSRQLAAGLARAEHVGHG